MKAGQILGGFIVLCLLIYTFLYNEKMSGLTRSIHLPSEQGKNASKEIYELKHQSAINLDFRRIELDSDDLFVFIHIQKTGGTTFEGNIVNHLQMKNPCKCQGPRRCTCNTPSNTTWLLGRFSGAWPCSTHNDWTELEECLGGKLQNLENKGRVTKNRR